MDAGSSTSFSPLPDFHPERLGADALESSITTLAANIAAATWQWLALIAEFDRREGWVAQGILSCAHWLNWKCGIALGALSYSKARAMTRVATPANEDSLLDIARHGTAMQVERAVQAYREALRIEDTARAERAHAARSLPHLRSLGR